MFFRYAFLLYLFCASYVCCTYEYPFRDIEKPVVSLDSVDRILILSPPRSGSTLVYMVFQYLFENTLASWDSLEKKVLKTHSIEAAEEILRKYPNTYVILSIRDPLDSFISRLRLNPTKSHKKITQILHDHISMHASLQTFLLNTPHTLLCRYEKFAHDIYSLLAEIEAHFMIVIPEQEQQNIEQLFSKDAVLARTRKYASFNEFDCVTSLHGDHIAREKKSLDAHLSGRLLKQVEGKIQQIQKLWDYE